MDIFRFLNPTNKTKMEVGKIVNGLKSKMWIERYRDAGEFTLTANVDSDVKTQLPIGSFISHIDTPEIMIVENHEIKDSRDKEAEIVITGRSFETIMENRIIGNTSNKTYPFSSATGIVDDFNCGTNTCAMSAAYLGQVHTQTAFLSDDNDALLWISFTVVGSPGGASAPRIVKQRDPVYKSIIELLEVDNLGVKITRPTSSNANTVVGFHKGTDRSKSIIRSYDTGEVESIDYLWSNKQLKNAALVSGKWVEVMVNNASIKEYDRRIMAVDGKDIDGDYTSLPTGTNLTNVINAMTQRGNEALSHQNNIAITKAEVAKSAIKYTYRKDYNVGDLITVSGDYNEISVMRVSEYVEIEDETGESGYPTLAFD